MLLGAIVNCLVVLAGGLIGAILKRGISERVGSTVMSGLALCVIYIGISGALEGSNVLLTIVSIAIGGVAGELFDLDRRLDRLGQLIDRKFTKEGQQQSLAQGFVTASLLFGVGAMAVVGSLQSGLAGNHETLFAKSVIDGISAIILGSTLGFGVALSGFLLLIYEGGITLSANLIEPFLTQTVIRDMTCIGSLLIIGIGLNMLKLTRIKVINLVPAVFVPLIYELIKTALRLGL